MGKLNSWLRLYVTRSNLIFDYFHAATFMQALLLLLLLLLSANITN
jgi:hypothetical protein